MFGLKLGPFASGNTEEADAATSVPIMEPPRFINVDPFVVPVFIGDTIGAQIQVTIQIEAFGEEHEQTIKKLLPRLSNAFYKDLYAFIPRLLREADRINVLILRKRLQLIAEKVAGPGIADGILIQSVTDSRIKPENNL